MTGARLTPTHLSLAGFAIVLLIAWFCYRPAIGGGFVLDDQSHFSGLAAVEDLDSAIDYVLAGSNGPTGRPVAMLSFALQASHYSEGAAAFLLLNVLIHLLNGVLLVWVCVEIALACRIPRERALLIGVATSAIWLTLALNATATVLAVQRMTTLSASFVLLGLAGYLAMRRRMAGDAPSLLPVTAVLLAATGAATLTKETGILLPLLVLVLESTLLEPPAQIAARRWKTWKGVVLVLPGFVIAAYLVSRSIYPEWMVARRDFDGWERLLTQGQVLWLYLSKAVVGLPGRLGIFQPDVPIARSLLQPATLVSTLAWAGLAAYSLARRRRHPLLAFAVLWFLTGHLLESTVLPLELYFEHRNYLPIIGPVLAVCVFLLQRSRIERRFSLGIIGAIVAFNAFCLYVFASMWGEPSTSARYWALRYPESVRAAGTLASYQLAEEGPQQTIDTIRRFTLAHREHAYMKIQELNLLCLYGASGSLGPIAADLERRLASVDFTYSAGSMLSQLFSTTTRTDCEVDAAMVRRLAGVLVQNPRYSSDPYFNQFYYKLLAGIARFEGDTGRALEHLDTAISFWATPELNMMMVTALVDENEFERARRFIDTAEQNAPANPFKALAWRRELDNLRTFVQEVDMLRGDGEHDEQLSGPEADES